MSDTALDILATPIGRPAYHGGLLEIAPRLLEELDITFAGCSTQGDFLASGIFARLRDVLQLPDTVTIHALWIDWMRYQMWYARIEGPVLPEVQEAYELPRFVAVYHRTGLVMRFVEFRPFIPYQTMIDFYADYYCSNGAYGLPRLTESEDSPHE